MMIDGMRTSTRRIEGNGLLHEFVPTRKVVRAGSVRVRTHPDGAVVEYVDRSGRRPGLEEGEFVSVNLVDDDVIDRMVRALASLHMGIEEAETGFTEADREMIVAGFHVGRMPDGTPAWMLLDPPWTTIVQKGTVLGEPAPGLPATKAGTVALTLVGPTGTQTCCTVDGLDIAFAIMRSGRLRYSYDPVATLHFSYFDLSRNRNRIH